MQLQNERKGVELAGRREIARLPEELLSAAISRTTPRDACRCAAVSAAFRSAADSDEVWSRFLPLDLPPLAAGELDPPPPSKKDLFFRLCDRPVLLADRRMTLGLERKSAAKCYMLSARKLSIVWSYRRNYWRWIPLSNSRFPEGALLMRVCPLKIRGSIESLMLSPNVTYYAYLVFKMAGKYCDYYELPFGATTGIEGDEMEDWERVVTDRPRKDGWMEFELGELFNNDGANGMLCFTLTEAQRGSWKRGLIVQGIEIKPREIQPGEFDLDDLDLDLPHRGSLLHFLLQPLDLNPTAVIYQTSLKTTPAKTKPEEVVLQLCPVVLKCASASLAIVFHS